MTYAMSWRVLAQNSIVIPSGSWHKKRTGANAPNEFRCLAKGLKGLLPRQPILPKGSEFRVRRVNLPDRPEITLRKIAGHGRQ